MPTYSYSCNKCHAEFELFFYIKDYVEKPKCVHCGSKRTSRETAADALTQSSSVRKSDSELKTIGDIAMRNTERMSDDEKAALNKKHNEYKDEKYKSDPDLPTGMKRIKKPQKPNWNKLGGK